MSTCDHEPTPEQIADILEKAHAVHAAKVAYDTAVLEQQGAELAAATAQAAWIEAVNSDADDATLTSLLTDYVSKKIVEIGKNETRAQTAQTYAAVQTALQQAIDAVVAGASTAPSHEPRHTRRHRGAS